MIDLNLLDHYNLFYKSNRESTFDKSLLNFLLEKILPQYNEGSFQFLEIGCGTKSVFESVDNTHFNITAVDFSQEAINIAKAHSQSKIKYLCASVSHLNFIENNHFAKNSFDLIFDAHCLHCLVDPFERKTAFSILKTLLKSNGIMASEMLISNKFTNVNHRSQKYEANAFDLEQEFLNEGFKIKYFVVHPGYSLESEGKKFDLLRVILSIM